MESIYFTRKMSNGDISCWHLRFDTHDTAQSQYYIVYSGSVVCEPGLWNTEWSKSQNVDLFVFVCFSNSYNLYFKKLEETKGARKYCTIAVSKK